MHSLMGGYSDLNERLCVSVQTGNYDEVLACLMEGARASLVLGSIGGGRTAIGTAALVGDVEILELLIQSCVEPDLDIFHKNCSNPLEMEIDSTPDGMDNLEWEDEFNALDTDDTITAEDAMDQKLYVYYAKTFERTGAIINSIDDYCISRGVRVLQDPHSVDAHLMTPLHYAAACGHLNCIELLLENGARIDAVNSDAATALHVGSEYSEVTRFLLKHGANPNLKTIDTGETALHMSIRNRCSSVATLILQTNANINETDDNEQTPLMSAIIHDLDEIASTLIERGARINFQDKNGFTALYYAVQHDNFPLAERLLARGARRITSHYLLHHCVDYNQRQMAELLLDHGENLNVRNREGVTALQLALQGSQRVDMLEYLLKVANTQARQGKFIVAVGPNELIFAVQFIASLQEFRPIARLLFAYGENTCWTTTSMSSSAAAMTASAVCYTPYCQNALSRAIMLHKLDIAEFLIKEGFDITQICRDHVVNNLRSMVAPGYLELAKLLVHVGFKFPYRKSPFPKNWQAERVCFEDEMQQLCSTPLTLQSLTRIVLRRQLRQVLTNSKEANLKYHATKQESGLSRIIKQLEIPRVLQTFLIDFDDCPTVMNRKFSTTLGVDEN